MIKSGSSYTRSDLDGEAFDVVVIGSGIGGLTTAALLTRFAGKRVLVLERHYVAGGFTHSFSRPGYDWDVGIHYVGDMTKDGHPIARLLDTVTDGKVEWADMGEVYDRIVIGDEVYDYVKGIRQWKARMAAYFPGEESTLDAYVDLVKAAAHAGQGYFLDKALPGPVSAVAGRPLRRRFLQHAGRTTAEVIGELTDDPRLAAVLTGQFGDYGLPPGRSSFAMHAIVTNHYFGGGAYPVGGASVIPAAIVDVIERGGGQVLVGAEVEEILVEGDRAMGVRMADGRQVRAAAVVSNAGVHTTYGQLLPDAVAQRIGAPRLLGDVERSVSHLTLYLGLDASTEALGLERPNLWLYPSDDHDGNVAAYEADPSQPFPLVYLSFPSAKDPDFARRHPGHSTIDVITLARHEWFAEWDGTRWHRRGEAYEARKAEFTERLLEVTTAAVPSIAGHVDVAELSTPLTTKHFTNFGMGELYGLAHTTDRFAQKWLRVRTPIRGLYLTGADVMTAGFGSALFAGGLTAGAMLDVGAAANLLRRAMPFLPPAA